MKLTHLDPDLHKGENSLRIYTIVEASNEFFFNLLIKVQVRARLIEKYHAQKSRNIVSLSYERKYLLSEAAINYLIFPRNKILPMTVHLKFCCFEK